MLGLWVAERDTRACSLTLSPTVTSGKVWRCCGATVLGLVLNPFPTMFYNHPTPCETHVSALFCGCSRLTSRSCAPV